MAESQQHINIRLTADTQLLAEKFRKLAILSRDLSHITEDLCLKLAQDEQLGFAYRREPLPRRTHATKA